jgi:ornithine carbamoyltransferase
MKHLLSLKEVFPEFIEEIIDRAIVIKKNPEKYQDILRNKTLAMLFQKTSTRTRVSFESAMTQLGGHAQYLDWRTTNFTLGDLQDEIKCLARYVDIIMARVYKHRDLIEMAKVSRVPIINGLSELEHPCQILADLLTIKEKKGDWKDLKISFLGDGNNVCNSLIIGGTKVGAKVFVATPRQYRPAEFAEKIGHDLNRYSWGENPEVAIKEADVVYTDTWVSMGREEEKKERLKIFPPYQVNRKLMKLAKKEAIFMHCLPVHRGEEVTDEILDSPQSVVYDQAENRLHIQKAIILKLLNKI